MQAIGWNMPECEPNPERVSAVFKQGCPETAGAVH